MDSFFETKLKDRLAYWQVKEKTSDYFMVKYPNCAYCGVPLTGDNYSVEHVLENPEKDAKDEKEEFARVAIIPENIALCCRGCNRSKGAKKLEVWLSNATASEYFILHKEEIIKHTTNPNHRHTIIHETAKKAFKQV